jgi:aerobic-type carbon monoxide dehydrogenase small subunit (CoxS/CutS family)
VEDAKGHEIRTIEGVADNAVAVRVRKAWLDLEVIQCGYCQPGQIMSAVALLTQISKPTDSQIDAAMSGNICRCGTYPRIRKAIHLAAE